jgi:hypothetical protein
MGHRLWIKLWVKEVIHGTTLKELEPDERAVWFELLCVAGDSVISGKVCISEELGYTDDQLCTLLKVDGNLLNRAIKSLENVEKIKRNGNNIIEICNFDKYQGSDEELIRLRKANAKHQETYRIKHQIKGKRVTKNKSNKNVNLT